MCRASWRRGSLLLVALLAAQQLSAAAPACDPLVAAAAVDPHTIAYGHGLLWRVRGPGDRSSYLFGTMHVADQRVLAVLEHVRVEFEQSDQFVLEVVLDGAATSTAQTAMFFGDGQRLPDIAGQALFETAARHLADYGIGPKLAASMKPWAAFVTLSMPAGVAAAPLDLRLLAAAQGAGKGVIGLETIDEQLSVFEHLAKREQVEMLREIVCNYARFQRELGAMVDAYVAGDLAALMLESLRYSTANQAAFLDTLLWQRNRRMAARLVPVLAAGHAFVAIGALHLPGARGVLHLLEQQGYRIEAVY